MYAIAFDLSKEAGERHFGDNWKGCYERIARVLAEYGFARQQGSLYFGNSNTSATTCMAAVLDMDRQWPWFHEVVRDLRMLRIDENDDLLAILPHRLRFDREDVA